MTTELYREHRLKKYGKGNELTYLSSTISGDSVRDNVM